MSEKLPQEKPPGPTSGSQEYQKNKAPTKIPGTAVFRSPYSIATKSPACIPYYIMSTPVAPKINPNASDEDKRRHIHNESERKRKDKMSKWVVRLSSLVPDCQPKMSRNAILEKTVQFVEQLKQESELPNDVQALKAEIVKLTKNVEYLSTENSHFLSLLKEAQNLSRGAWSLNMSIHRNQSSGSDGEDSTTMTPTLDRVSVSNLTKASSTPNLPTIVPASGTQQKLYTLPQPIQVTLQPKTMANAVANATPTIAVAATPLVQGNPIMAQATPVQLAGVQVKDSTVLKTTNPGAGGATHSIQALLGDNSNTSKTLYLQTAGVPSDGATNAVYMTNSPIVAAAAPAQTPVVIQGENGPVVIMIPASLPLQAAVPLNTMSSSHIMCEPTAYFKSPIVLNQFPQLLNYTPENANSQQANAQGVQGVQVGSAVIQGTQQPMVVGTQPVIAQLTTSATTMPTMVNVNQATPVIQQGGMVGVHTTPVAAPVIQAEVLIPQVTSHQGGTTQCFIPMDGHHIVPVQQVTTTLTSSGEQSSLQQPTVSRNANVTDFSISQICQTQQYNSLAGHTEEQSDHKSEDIYLSTSDSSFGSECYTPPGNVMLSSSAAYPREGTPEPEGGKSLSHSIANLTGNN